MAATIARSVLNNIIKSSYSYGRNEIKAKTLISVKWCSTTNSGPSGDKPEKDLEELFLKPDVQTLLKKITGFDIEKIFKQQQIADFEAPKYKLLTEEQLKEYEENAVEKGQEKLQMPPVKRAWSSHERGNLVLSADHDIANFDTSGIPYVFTDISNGLPRRNRVIVVRESDGTLRLADHEERDRVLQVYYPSPGKMYQMPKMFHEENLEKVLSEHRYEYVLGRACIQFEPDDPNYIRVTQRTYEHIATQKKFEDLRSTRHFGPMAFYFAFYRKIDQLLLDMLQRDLLSDAEDLVKLYHILHPKCQSAIDSQQNKASGIPLIQLFAKHDAVNGGIIEMALQSYEEAHPTLRHSDSS